jgi:hypothetical protein
LTADAAAAEDFVMPQSYRPLVVDADGHVCEPPDLWERNLPASMRERGPRVRWSDPDACEQVPVEDSIAIPRGLPGLCNAGTGNFNFGDTSRYVDGHRAGFDARERLAVLDAGGHRHRRRLLRARPVPAVASAIRAGGRLPSGVGTTGSPTGCRSRPIVWSAPRVARPGIRKPRRPRCTASPGSGCGPA